LSKPLSNLLGGIGPMVLVYKISTFVNIVDVFTMQTYEIDQMVYWKHQFGALCGRDRLVPFIVLNIENTDYEVNVSRAAARQKFKMVQVELARASDFGKNDKTFIVNTHLGEILNYNDTVLCYDMDAMNMMELDEMENCNRPIPQVIIVKKTFPKFRKAQKDRVWKLKHLKIEAVDDKNIHEKKYKKGKATTAGNKDMEMFKAQIEDDPELRSQINLYRVSAFKS
jgi:nonsense-mediated mRNA decay protein 3